MMEEWKDIEGYEGKYQVSNLGNVRSLNYNKTKKSKILKFGINSSGYKIVVLCKNGNPKTYKVHRLVAQAFLLNPQNLLCINHKDENPLNNCVYNLEWCTYKYNNNYGSHNEKISQKMIGNPKISGDNHPKPWLGKLGKLHNKSKPIYQYNLDGKFIRIWDSTMDIQRELGYNQGNISLCALGKRKTAYGFLWKYAS